MKVLILSATIGQGHNSCAEAIKHTFTNLGCKADIVDMYGNVSPYLKELISKSYITGIKTASTQYTKFLGNITYNSMEKAQLNKKSNLNIILKPILKNVYKLIKTNRYDVVIATQVHCAHILNELKKNNSIKNITTVGVLTDYTVQSHWKHAGKLDYIITPSELLNYNFKKIGIKTDKIKPIGIPINTKFAKSFDKTLARTLIEINPITKTVLIMAGSMGYGNIKETILKLDNLKLNFQIIVVCGKNKKLFESLKSLKTRKHIKVYGFTKKVDLIMDASDIIITKAGGITISEALSKGLAIIFSNSIPGMEDLNIEFLLNQGVAMKATKTFPVEQAVYNLISNEKLLCKMSTNSKQIAKPLSSVSLYNILYNKRKNIPQKINNK